MTLSFVPSGGRGHQKFDRLSSHVMLSSGERYSIYRFLLYLVGFERTSGKKASGEGFYLMFLNLPQKARSSPNAVRIVSLTPPWINNEEVFKNIQEDIVKYMTEGFQDFDAYGQPIRIFLDLFGFLGEAPAINAALDVLRHTGSACRYMCLFNRSPLSLIGSRYARPARWWTFSRSGHGFPTNGNS